MAKKNTGNGGEQLIDGDGFERQDTVDGDSGVTYADAEWVEPAAGTVIEGELTRAFVIPDTLGGDKAFRACFVAKDANGDEWTFGEKAAFKVAIRALNVGDAIKLTFKGKEPVKKNGKPTGKTAWRVELLAKRTGGGKRIADELMDSFRQLKARGEDLPF